jgi:hypothetical protein
MHFYDIAQLIGFIGVTIVLIYATYAARPPKLDEEDLK